MESLGDTSDEDLLEDPVEDILDLGNTLLEEKSTFPLKKLCVHQTYF